MPSNGWAWNPGPQRSISPCVVGRSRDQGEWRFENLVEALLVWGAPLSLLGTWQGKAGLSVASRGPGPRALGMRVPGGSSNMGRYIR